MYESPIKVFQKQLESHLEEDVLKAVMSYNVVVDKEELLRALKYDRDSYYRGYEDGIAAAERHGKWQFTDLRQIGPSCSRCGYITVTGLHNYCPVCGAKMDGGAENETD